MGWRGTMRSLQAAQRRAERQHSKAVGAIHRTHDSQARNMDRDFAGVRRQAVALERRIASDPIEALGIQYSLSGGFRAQPLLLESGDVSVSISVGVDPEDPEGRCRITPDALQGPGFRLSVLDICTSRWATFVAFYVDNSDPNYRIRLNWFKKTDNRASAVFLLDPEASIYYYPIASQLRGEVVTGHPQVGVIAFEPFQRPTTRVAAHLSNLKLSAQAGRRETAEFVIENALLAPRIEANQRKPTLLAEVDALLRREQESALKQIASARERALQSAKGCSIALMGGAALMGAAVWSLLIGVGLVSGL